TCQLSVVSVSSRGQRGARTARAASGSIRLIFSPSGATIEALLRAHNGAGVENPAKGCNEGFHSEGRLDPSRAHAKGVYIRRKRLCTSMLHAGGADCAAPSSCTECVRSFECHDAAPSCA